MKEKCCANCSHFEKRDNIESFYWSSDRYTCKFHKLYDGEVSDPHWQSCPQHYSNISKLRNDKLKELGI